MRANMRCARLLAPMILGIILATGAAAQDAGRYACLQYDHVEAIHQLGHSHMILEVEGGTTLYLITVEDRCFRGIGEASISIEGNGTDNCIRTSDTVHANRRQCDIVDFELIETQEQLEQLLAGQFD